MRELGVDKIFIDKASGKNTARKELQNYDRVILNILDAVCHGVFAFARSPYAGKP